MNKPITKDEFLYEISDNALKEMYDILSKPLKEGEVEIHSGQEARKIKRFDSFNLGDIESELIKRGLIKTGEEK